MELKDFINQTHLHNTDNNLRNDTKSFDTNDYVFLESYGNMLGQIDRQLFASDYAVLNGARLDDRTNGRQYTNYWLRSAISYERMKVVDHNGTFAEGEANDKSHAIAPVLSMNIIALIAYKTLEAFKIQPVTDKNGKTLYHTMEFGSYPQDLAPNSHELDQHFNKKELTLTGKTYIGRMNDDGTFENNQEYEYKGQKYVRVICQKQKAGQFARFKDGTRVPNTKKSLWTVVQPIRWKIKNWDKLPNFINPYGTATDNNARLQAEEAILAGIPFTSEIGKEEDTMWQNSPIRAMLNGYDLSNELLHNNGNKRYAKKYNYNFKGQGFLDAVFSSTISNTVSQSTTVTNNAVNTTLNNFQAGNNQSRYGIVEIGPRIRKSKLTKLNPDNTPLALRRQMTDTEMIKNWIDAGQSVLLRGPSGIGKTARIKSLYPDLIYIKLTNNMFPEKVVGSMNLQTGQAIPPDFAKQAIMSCATEDEKKLIQDNVQNLFELADTIYQRSQKANGKTVILLDELLNVKPAVQSLVYTLVLNKIVETGKGLKLPANTVVVATGNQKKYSSVAEDLAEPLEKRFDHILDMQPKVIEWISEFAIPHRLHPSVIGYILSKYQENKNAKNVSNIGYFYEEPEVGEKCLDQNGCRGRTNDPRGWESISNMLYAFESDLKKGKFVGKDVEDLLQVSLGTKLREEWAAEFFDFYNYPTVSIEEIMGNKYTEADLPQDINEKFATMTGLLGASFDQVGPCRDFLRQHCDPEYLAIYDLYWAGHDEKRMEKLQELQDMTTINSGDKGLSR